jgi:hypothetical protein
MDIDKLRKLKTVIAEYDSNSENEYEHHDYMLNAMADRLHSEQERCLH